jgi:formate dehydrogenase subunit beta
MKVETVINVKKGNILGTVRDFLASLLKEGVVDYLLVPEAMASGQTQAPSLIKDPAFLAKANPFSPVMPMNTAAVVSQLTNDNPGKKLGVVLRPCEIRALVELVKLNQANLKNVTLIGIDCLGTVEVEDYAKFMKEASGSTEEKEALLLTELKQNINKPGETKLSIPLRPACNMCVYFTPTLADITLSLYGPGDNISVNLEDTMAKKLKLEVKDNPVRQEVVKFLLGTRTVAREKVLQAYRDKTKTVVDFADDLSTCIRCYACSSACPICYCRICFFKTDTFKPESERYYRWADKEGALRMPTETLLYHLTRMNHVGASCVSCGMCESACPRNIPLTTMFAAVADSVQKALNYTSGKSLDNKIPLSSVRPEGA